MIQYHVNLCAQRMARHRDVSSSLFTFMDQPLVVICQPRCHHLDSIRGRGKCGKEKDVAIWKLKVAVVASTSGFKPVPPTVQSPAIAAAAAAAAEAERPEQKTPTSTNAFTTISGLAAATAACSGPAGGWPLHTWGTQIAKAICHLRLEMRPPAAQKQN